MKKLIISLSCLLFLIGCDKSEPLKPAWKESSTLPSMSSDNLEKTLDILSYRILQESDKAGFKKLIIPAVASGNRPEAFVAEEVLRRLYVNRNLKVITPLELTALIKQTGANKPWSESEISGELGVDSLLRLSFEQAGNDYRLLVELSSYPERKIKMKSDYRIQDTTSSLIATIKEGRYFHPGSRKGKVIWEENFDKETPDIWRKTGAWVIQDGKYTPLGGTNEPLINNMAVFTSPIKDHKSFIFEGDCYIANNGEAGLLVKGATPNFSVFVIFSASRQMTGFVLRKEKKDQWLSGPIKYRFPTNRPFHFEVFVDKQNYFLFIDKLPVTRMREEQFSIGIIGGYVNMKGSLPVFWDNLKILSL